MPHHIKLYWEYAATVVFFMLIDKQPISKRVEMHSHFMHTDILPALLCLSLTRTFPTNSKQQTANSKQQTANSKQQTANSLQVQGSVDDRREEMRSLANVYKANIDFWLLNCCWTTIISSNMMPHHILLRRTLGLCGDGLPADPSSRCSTRHEWARPTYR